jgi:hypothetical protein
LRNFMLFCSVYCLCGCVPAVTSYYRPSSAVGRITHGVCETTSPADVWEVQVAEATIRAVIKGRSLGIRVLVPTGSRAQLASAEVSVTADGKSQVSNVIEWHYTADAPRSEQSAPADGVLEGGALSFLIGKDQPRQYETWLPIDKAAVEEYEVSLPSILVNGKLHRIEVIRFSKQRGVGLFPINC